MWKCGGLCGSTWRAEGEGWHSDDVTSSVIRPAAPNPCPALILLILALPLQVFSTKLSESINAVDGGFITTPNTQELVLQTFTGKVR